MESTVTREPVEITIGKRPVRQLANDLCMAGMGWTDAVDEAFDYYVRKSGRSFAVVGEVVLPAESSKAQCASALGYEL